MFRTTQRNFVPYCAVPTAKSLANLRPRCVPEFADEYPYLRFHGDAKFSGGQVFGYEIKMRSLPFNQPGEYVFHFRGILDEDVSLLLYPYPPH